MTNYLIWSLFVALYSPVFWKLYNSKWESIDYTHAYFILPLSIWLIWRKRAELHSTLKFSSDKNLSSMVILCFGLIIYLFGWRQDYFSVYTFSMVPVLFGLVGYIYGKSTVKLLRFPFLYLLFLVPPPLGIIDSITLPMRKATSVATENILHLLQYPIKREGLILTIGYFDIFMAEECSGFRSLITMYSLIFFYLYIIKSTVSKRIILASFILPFALFGNLVRVITLCLITYYFGEEAGQGFFHNFSGIVIFIITLTGLMGLESLLNTIKPLNPATGN